MKPQKNNHKRKSKMHLNVTISQCFATQKHMQNNVDFELELSCIQQCSIVVQSLWCVQICTMQTPDIS